MQPRLGKVSGSADGKSLETSSACSDVLKWGIKIHTVSEFGVWASDFGVGGGTPCQKTASSLVPGTDQSPCHRTCSGTPLRSAHFSFANCLLRQVSAGLCLLYSRLSPVTVARLCTSVPTAAVRTTERLRHLSRPPPSWRPRPQRPRLPQAAEGRRHRRVPRHHHQC